MTALPATYSRADLAAENTPATAAMPPLLTVDDLAAILHLSPETIRTKLSRAPDKLPPRAPTYKPLWHPDVVDQWTRGAVVRRNKGGRPRKVVA